MYIVDHQELLRNVLLNDDELAIPTTMVMYIYIYMYICYIDSPSLLANSTMAGYDSVGSPAAKRGQRNGRPCEGHRLGPRLLLQARKDEDLGGNQCICCPRGSASCGSDAATLRGSRCDQLHGHAPLALTRRSTLRINHLQGDQP